jgi:putative copper export protein
MLYGYLVLFHLLGACVWVGGHLILSLSVLPKALKAKNTKVITEFENSFEKIGIPALLIQVLTGVFLSMNHIQWNHLFSTHDRTSMLVITKLILLAVTVLLAAHARLKLIPKLNKKTLPLLGLHIVAVTVTGILFVIAGLSFRTNLFF